MVEGLRKELTRGFAEAWRPEPGDVLIGQVVGLDEGRGFAGDPYPIVSVRTEAGAELAFHAFHSVAKDELTRLEPKVGETIGIAYHGRHPEKDYARYRIKVVREDAVRDVEPELATAAEQVAAGADVDDIPF